MFRKHPAPANDEAQTANQNLDANLGPQRDNNDAFPVGKNQKLVVVRMWRSLGGVNFLIYGGRKGLYLGNIRWHGSHSAILYVNGNLHWLVYQQENNTITGRVCTFDQ